jgi:protein-S-isoprenylcysteine O-methyltransferase Ste14
MPHLVAVASVIVIAGLLFGSAGRWDLPFFWTYIALNVALVIEGLVYTDPGLQRERLRPGGKDVLPMLLMALILGLPAYLGHFVVAGLDVGRYQWSAPMPIWVQVTAVVVWAASWSWVMWAMTVNRFFSSVVRVQSERGHHVITTGPYRYVRHPGYAGAIVGFIASPIALGSWWALAPVVPMVVFILWRTALEDRFLHANLPGYPQYADQVRDRLLPGLW